jgi:hypothetical protein
VRWTSAAVPILRPDVIRIAERPPDTRRGAVHQVQSNPGVSRCKCSALRHPGRRRPAMLGCSGHGGPGAERSSWCPARTRPGTADRSPAPTGSHRHMPGWPAGRHPQPRYSIREPPRATLRIREIDVSTPASSSVGRELAIRRRPAEDTVRLRSQAGPPRISVSIAVNRGLPPSRVRRRLPSDGPQQADVTARRMSRARGRNGSPVHATVPRSGRFGAQSRRLRPAGRWSRRFSGHHEKLTGDGLLARFDGPSRAIRCGTAIRDAARRIGLDVRVGSTRVKSTDAAPSWPASPSLACLVCETARPARCGSSGRGATHRTALRRSAHGVAATMVMLSLPAASSRFRLIAGTERRRARSAYGAVVHPRSALEDAPQRVTALACQFDASVGWRSSAPRR